MQEATKDIIDRYRSLPYEESELYKRNFFRVPLEEFEASGAKSTTATQSILNDVATNYKGIKFDIVIRDGVASINNKKINVVRADGSHKIGLISSKIESVDKATMFMQVFADNVLEINAGAETNEINILNVSSSERIVNVFNILCSENSKLKVTELNLSSHGNKSLFGVLNYAELGNNASLELNVINNSDSQTYSLISNYIDAIDSSSAYLNSVYCNSMVTKASSRVRLNGARASSRVNELAYITNGQKLDAATSTINAGVDTESSVDSRVIAGSGSEAIIKGYAEVKKGAVGSSTHINEKGTIIDGSSKIQAIPDMLIKEKNVKAAKHKADVAPLSEDAVVYLCARGIDTSTAKKFILKSTLTSKLGVFTSKAAEALVPSMLIGAMDSNNKNIVYKQNTEGVWA